MEKHVIYFDSLTGNTKRFCMKVQTLRPEWTILQLSEDMAVDMPGHLMTYTFGIGNIPLSTAKFMKINKGKILTVSSTGNRNWGIHYCEAADKLSKHYKLPILMKLEMSGFGSDVEDYIRLIESFDNCK